MTDAAPAEQDSSIDSSGLEGLTSACERAGITLHAGTRRWDVVLSRPERRNAQTPATWQALVHVGRAVRRHRPEVVVLRALGPSFSGGLDTSVLTGTSPGASLPAMAGLPDDDLDAQIAGFQQAFTWWRDVDAVTVAAVQGHAVGAGFQLALACDLRVVADDVQLVMKETSLGLVPDLAGTATLVEALGYSTALHVCLTGRPVGAPEAVARGLAVRAVPAADLASSVDELVTSLLRPPPGAVGDTKALLRNASERTASQQQAEERRLQARRLRRLAEEARTTGR